MYKNRPEDQIEIILFLILNREHVYIIGTKLKYRKIKSHALLPLNSLASQYLSPSLPLLLSTGLVIYRVPSNALSCIWIFDNTQKAMSLLCCCHLEYAKFKANTKKFPSGILLHLHQEEVSFQYHLQQ